MTTVSLSIQLLSDSTPGSGGGLPGVVDTEIEHDQYGLPYLRGRTLKGLLVEASNALLFNLSEMQHPKHAEFATLHNDLFGEPGAQRNAHGQLSIGNATLSPAVMQFAKYQFEQALYEEKGNLKPFEERFQPLELLAALTGIRAQTSIAPDGGPEQHSLRNTRVIIRDQILTADLFGVDAQGSAREEQLMWLAAVAANVRHLGLNRNRGWGWISVALTVDGNDVTQNKLNSFETELLG